MTNVDFIAFYFIKYKLIRKATKVVTSLPSVPVDIFV